MILFLWACARETYDPADLQLDVQAAVPDNAETARICVVGVGQREIGAGNGRLAFPGIPPSPFVVQIDLLDSDGLRIGSTLPVEFTQAGDYLLTEYQEAEGEICTESDHFAEPGAESWLLGVRFLIAPW